ncbi:MAG: GMC family oxidoreductase [Bacteroidota bacterium]
MVVGTGISGGWAAKELTEQGIKTLVLEKGRMVKHGDYPTANLDNWDLPHNNVTPQSIVDEHYPKQNRTGYTVREAHRHWFVKDSEHPYGEDKRFDWMRGYHVGGRSIMWGRQSYRLSDMDFTANARDGIATDWPIRYAEIAPWYDKVETFAGISGELLGLDQLPDGKFLPMMPLNCAEDHLRQGVAKNMGGRVITAGRTAHLTAYNPAVHKGTRGQCRYRNRCIRGCPFGAYFSSLSATLPVAEATGNMTIRPNSSVYSLIYDKDTKKAKGVRVRDTETGEDLEFYAKVIFLCASAIASTFIVMNTEHEEEVTLDRSGQLGRNIMDHHFRVGASGVLDEYGDQYFKGRKPNGVYIPRFQNLPGKPESKKKNYRRGFGYQGGGSRTNWMRSVKEMDTTIGAELKQQMILPGPWQMGITAFAETLPYESNRMYINRETLDKDGLPTVTFDAEWGGEEYEMKKDMISEAVDMLEAAGFKKVKPFDRHSYPGLGIHEMGTARMGTSSKNSVLDKHNRLWSAPNVYMTDGAFMTSSACVNPSLTYMAFTARAASHAVSELKKQNI